jgi:flavin reductase (DIM6/NTAB) family NADH-FMN oxidoreductase RutF
VSAAEEFIELTGALDYPVYLVTTIADQTPAGCLVGFATQCSIDPARFLVCLSDKNLTCRVAARSEVLAVHFLPADAFELARRFGSETGDDTDKFAECQWRPGPGGVPIIEDCRRWFAGSIVERRRLGDHIGHLLEPLEVRSDAEEPLLTFQATKQLEPGHEA